MLVLGSVELRKMLPVTQTSLWFGLLKNLKINYQQSDVLQNVILRCYKQYTIYKYIQNVSCRIRGSGPYTRIWTLEVLQLSVTIFCIPNPWLQDKHRQTHGHHKKKQAKLTVTSSKHPSNCMATMNDKLHIQERETDNPKIYTQVMGRQQIIKTYQDHQVVN